VLKIAQVALLAITPISAFDLVVHVILKSVYLDGVFPDDVNKFELHLSFIQAFADKAFMQQILDDNPTKVSTLLPCYFVVLFLYIFILLTCLLCRVH